MKNKLLVYAKGVLFGVIGSLVGILPNAILKTLLIDTFILLPVKIRKSG